MAGKNSMINSRRVFGKTFLALACFLWVWNAVSVEVSGFEDTSKLLKFRPNKAGGALERGDSTSHIIRDEKNFASSSRAMDIDLHESEEELRLQGKKRERNSEIVKEEPMGENRGSHKPGGHNLEKHEGQAEHDTTNERMVHLQSSDGKVLSIKEKYLAGSNALKFALEQTEGSLHLPVQSSSEVLAQVVTWCKNHPNNGESSSKVVTKYGLTDWEAEFMKTMSLGNVFAFMEAGNYLELKSIMDACSHVIAESIKDKSSEAILQLFNLNLHQTEEEKEEMRMLNIQAFGKLDDSLTVFLPWEKLPEFKTLEKF